MNDNNWTVLHSFALLLPVFRPHPLLFWKLDGRWPAQVHEESGYVRS